MSKPVSPYEVEPPGSSRLVKSVIAAVVGAAIVLVTIVLPAEYNIDPTGIGGKLGLTSLNEPTRTIQIKDVIGGNETYREVEIPNPKDPTPLPNPAVFQNKTVAPRTETLTITLGIDEETEVKAVLDSAQAMLFSWSVQSGKVYTDFHGHDPEAGDEAWVRYEEQQEGNQGNGSLVAPFKGEHGWYWLNVSDHPVTITLNVSGYYDKLVDYGKL